MAIGIDIPKDAATPTEERKPSRLKTFGKGIMDLLQLLGEAKREEIIYGHATTDRFAKKQTTQEPPTDAQIEHANSMH